MEEDSQNGLNDSISTTSSTSSTSSSSLCISPFLSSTSPSPPSPPPACIADLPTEIIELIFDFVFHDGMSELPDNAQQLTHITRAWTRPVQRHLFRSVVGTSPVRIHRLTRFVQKEKDLAIRVESLKLSLKEVRSEAGAGVSMQELNRLVAALPNLTILTLELELRWTGGYAGIEEMPKIDRLCLKSDWRDKDYEAFRTIINATPNLTSLSLIPDFRPGPPLLRMRPYDPVDLPRLQHLALGHASLCPVIGKLDLLSEATMAQINSLEFNLRNSSLIAYSPLPLLREIGDHITQLTLGQGQDKEGQRMDKDILQACPNLHILVIINPINLTHFPSLMERIIYQGYFAQDMDWWTKAPVNRGVGVSREVADWRGVKTVEFQLKQIGWDGMWSKGYPTAWEDRWERVRHSFRGRGVELVLNGKVVDLESGC